ncbi:unnamed protein product [Adineta steineri]|uniref:Uncharacterized protein n=1 Tax=Adineta steineri TaxID=433720 RepID=A0A814IMX3_9BILA|nr:unnamed protein product [Adineta steineri]CAF0874322.1 unnamed protein product [Adineta steineri]CAF1023764.1 unnamed protein product [Adineta steineri]CAF3492276.1 unnamed protein product [Adineta steineri]CAF3528719.1 unnamed protein product [Adineta steineri]
MVREIVTLQIGNEANNVGVHFWNQLDIEQTHNNPLIDYNTYYTFNKKTNVPSPRALIIDYRNTFGYLLDEIETSLHTNKNDDSSIEIIKRPTESNVWSNKLKTKAKFHPKSLIPLTDYWYSPVKEENQFDIYPIGQQIYKKMSDQIENSLHYLLESCDTLQSFRCLYDVNNSFSGLFTSIQDYLHDECPKQPIWSFGVGNEPSELNLILSLIHSLNENQMPTLTCSNYDDTYKLGLAIQHSLLSTTLTQDILVDRLCPMKKNFLNLVSTIPFELKHKTLYHYLENSTDNVFQLTKPIACHYFLRGIDRNELYNQSLYKLNVETSADLIEIYLREQYGSKMFVSSDSWVEKYNHMSLITGLINDDNYSFDYFNNLLNKMKKMNYKLLSKRWHENDFDEQMFEQMMNDLNSLHEQYQLNTSE